ncbi:MAG: hypothetical protein J7K23_03615 [Thermoproteales archaeon]|nr:hypothetical protein [Thermoproteales archaeon]
MRRSLEISITALMGAFATVLSVLKVEIPFPILIYLKIDFAEIPVFLTYFLCNFRFGVIASLLHFLGLFSRSGDILGPSMKMIAEISNLTGMYVGLKIKSRSMIIKITSGIILRVLSMTLINIIVLEFLFPSYLYFSKTLLEQAGFYVPTLQCTLIYTLVFVAIYNIINASISVSFSYLIFRTIKKRLTSYFENNK